MPVFEVSAHMTVRPGQLEGFKKQAAECIRITKEKDTHTLRYDWFLSSDGTECEVREAYTGPEGLIEHNRNIVEARTRLFKDYADDHFMTFYGEPGSQLLDLLKAHHMENQFKWFTFVKGLGSSNKEASEPAAMVSFDETAPVKRLACAGGMAAATRWPTSQDSEAKVSLSRVPRSKVVGLVPKLVSSDAPLRSMMNQATKR